MANKATLQRLKLDPYFSKTIATNLNVWSHDINSYEIKFEFYDSQCDKPIDLTGADMRILLDHEGSQPKVYPLEIESKILGLAKFVMPEQIRGCEGKFTAHIYADYPNHTNDFGHFMFYTKISRIDGNMDGCLDTVYVSEFEKALQDIKNKSSQFDNVEEELNKRIEVIEKDIASNGIAKQEELDNLEVGGLNLLDGTKRFSQPWRTVGGTPIKDSDGFFYVRLKNIHTEWAYIRFDEWEKGEEYILSFYARSEQDVSLNPKIEIAGSPVWGIPITSREFKRYEIKFVWNFESSSGALQLLTRQNTTYIDVKKVKLEKANKSIGWQPSINETVDKMDVSDLQKQINELKNAITTLGGTL